MLGLRRGALEANLLPFRDLKLGFADAAIEASRAPYLLTEGFLNLDGVVEKLSTGERFLVLGNKGTGKTAIAEHLKFREGPTTFVRITDLATFPYNDLRQIVEDDQVEPTFPSAWSWLLLVSFLSSFAEDNGGNVFQNFELSRMHSTLSSAGLLPSAGNLNELLTLSRKRHYRVDLPFGIQIDADDEKAEDLHLPFFIEKLKTALLQFESPSSHFLIIDGLDEVLNLAESHLEPVSGLVSESFRVNSAFQKSKISAKIILLCRTDLFDRLPGSNTNKIRQDCSIRMNWYTDTYSSSPLWAVANLRAGLQTGTAIDILKSYFPAKVQRTDPYSLRVLPWQPAETGLYLLRHTRYTPRDFVQLLRSIQGESKQIRVLPGEIASALQDYANDYFLPEIRNELTGYCANEEVSALIEAFGLIRDSRFTLATLESKVSETVRPALPKMLRVLFDCSAIGNWEETERSAGFRTYRYKNRNCRLDLHAVITLHPALALAFNATDPINERKPSGELLSHHDKYNHHAKSATQRYGTVTFATPTYGFITDRHGETFHYRRSDVIDGYTIVLQEGNEVSFTKAPRKDPKYQHFSALNVRRIE